MSILKKLAGQTAIYGLSSILGRLLNYLLVPLYTRVFDPGEYGTVTQLYAFASFLNILFTYGLETSFFRYYHAEKGNPKVYSTALLSLVVSSIGFFVLIVLGSNDLASVMGVQDDPSGRLPLYIAWFGGILAADAVAALPFARLRQENKAVRFAVIRLVNIGLNIGFNLFFLIACPAMLKSDQGSWVASFYDPAYGVGYVVLSNLIASLATLLLLLPELRAVFHGFDKIIWKQLMIYGLPLMVAGFAGMINETFDRLMLPHLIKEPSTAMEQLGIYGACYKLSILMTLFIQTFRYAAEPFFFSQAGRDDARLIYARVMTWFVHGCAFIFLGVMLYVDFFQGFIGEKFRSGLVVVPILLLANLCLGVYYNLSVWYKLTSKTQWGAWLSVIGAFITLILNFALIPAMGYLGAAWATLVCYAVMMAISYAAGQRYYRIPYNLRALFLSVGSAIVLWGISVYFERIGFGPVVNTILNTGLLFLFAISVWLFERGKRINFAGNKN